MSRKGLWVHCMCGCGYTGRVVEENGGELAVKNCDEVRIYASSKVADGALCEVCGEKQACVVFSFSIPALLQGYEAEEAMCWRCFINAGPATAKNGVVIHHVKALTSEGQEGGYEPTDY